MASFHIHRQQNQKSRKWPWLLILALLLGVFVVLVSWYNTNLQPVSSSTEETVITVQAGAAATEIAEELESAGIIRSARVFDIYTRLEDKRNKLQAGGYKFSPSLSVQQIVQMLVDGSVATDLVTILPAQRLDQVAAAFVQAGYSASEVDTALEADLYRNHSALVDLPPDSSLEGYLYPDSYQRDNNTSLEDIVNASLDEMDRAITPKLVKAWADQGLTVHQAVTIASIVETEVSIPEDRLTVAQVFLKRYNEGIRLGADPTAFYGAIIGGLEPTVHADTPYNTRIYEGLPPGPISNVSSESLEAVAYPSDTNFLFFVAGDDGTTHFSRTLEEHEALTERYCTKLCQ